MDGRDEPGHDGERNAASLQIDALEDMSAERALFVALDIGARRFVDRGVHEQQFRRLVAFDLEFAQTRLQWLEAQASLGNFARRVLRSRASSDNRSASSSRSAPWFR